MQVDVVRAAQAEALLQADGFRAAWRELLERCSWATQFQSPGFVQAWYQTYRARYEPLFLLSTDGAGAPTGILCLAASKRDGEIVVAGAQQAEYSTWVCSSERADAFSSAALAAIPGLLGRRELRIGFLPPATPLHSLSSMGGRSRLLVQPHSRPLMRFGDGQAVEKSLKKSGNKKKLNQLRRLGEMGFRRLTTPAELEQWLDTIVCYHDIRHLGMRGSTPFHNDPLKREFCLALMAVPELMSVAVLQFGQMLACAHIGTRGRREVELGLTAYNPMLARYSPGKHLVLLLAQMLHRDGYEQLDLTAGGEAYKDRHANAWDEVHTLTVFPSASRRWAGAARTTIRRSAKSMLTRLHINPTAIRSGARELSFARLARFAASSMRRPQSAEFMSRGLAGALSDVSGHIIQRDAVEHLLAYRPDRGMPSPRQFAADALRRLESGQHLYSCVVDGRLVHVGWLREEATEHALPEESFADPLLKRGCAVVLALNTNAAARGKGIGATSLAAMSRDCSRLATVSRLALAVDQNNPRARGWLKSLGFAPLLDASDAKLAVDTLPITSEASLESVGK